VCPKADKDPRSSVGTAPVIDERLQNREELLPATVFSLKSHEHATCLVTALLLIVGFQLIDVDIAALDQHPIWSYPESVDTS
jgi:hypothetical protein